MGGTAGAQWLLVALGDTTWPLYPMRMGESETAGHSSDLRHHSWVVSPNTVTTNVTRDRCDESHKVMGHEFPSPRATSWVGALWVMMVMGWDTTRTGWDAKRMARDMTEVLWDIMGTIKGMAGT